MTCNEYDELQARAGEQCELCGTAETDTPRGALIIDHFQGGGLFFVRGLLCDKCNSVMSRHDRTAPWGPASLPFKEQARAYHLRAFDRPTDEEFQRADKYIASHGLFTPGSQSYSQPSYRSPRGKPHVRLDHGPKHIARKLRDYLKPEQLARLVELLTEEGTSPTA
jgi:hypothetical protein